MKWIDKTWHEDLIWCPSQITRNLEFDGVKAQAYLRWRWEDPWTADVIFIDNNTLLSNWVELPIPEFSDDQYKEAEKWVENYLENPENGWRVLAKFHEQKALQNP